MSGHFNPTATAGKLTPAQRSTVFGLDETFCVLGCSEPYAIRLCRDGTRRPALVQMRQGEQYKEFALTEAGVLVKAQLTDVGS